MISYSKRASVRTFTVLNTKIFSKQYARHTDTSSQIVPYSAVVVCSALNFMVLQLLNLPLNAYTNQGKRLRFHYTWLTDFTVSINSVLCLFSRLCEMIIDIEFHFVLVQMGQFGSGEMEIRLQMWMQTLHQQHQSTHSISLLVSRTSSHATSISEP